MDIHNIKICIANNILVQFVSFSKGFVSYDGDNLHKISRNMKNCRQ